MVIRVDILKEDNPFMGGNPIKRGNLIEEDNLIRVGILEHHLLG